MKKKKLIWIIATVILAAVCVAFLAVSSLDEIVSTEVNKNVGAYGGDIFVTHTFKNGKTIDVKFRYNLITLGEGVYYVEMGGGRDDSWDDVVQRSNASYNLSNLSFSAHIKDNDGGWVFCPHSCATGKQGEPTGAGVSFAAYDNTELDCEAVTRDDYIHGHFIIKGNFELSDLEISYDLNGKGMRLGSNFEEQKTSIHLGHKAPPYDTEPAEE